MVLCAGALDSSAILLRSGIGPRAELEQHGIEVVADLPGVGRNLHDHCLSPVIFRTERQPVGPPTSGVSVTQTHLFWRSREGLRVPVTPKSRGALTLSGPGPDDPVRIDPGVLSAEEDLRTLTASVRQCRSIGRRPALARAWGAIEIYPGPEVGDEELEDYVRRTVITYHHQVGTCRMGVDDDAVVDPRLRLRGVAGLRVIDASIMPTITTGNTNAPAVLIGELGVRRMLEDTTRDA